MGQISYAAEIRRKLIHLGNLVIPVGVYFAGSGPALCVLIPVMALSIALDVARARSEPVREFVARHLGSILRPHEQGDGGAIVLTGGTWVLIAAVMTFAIFPDRIGIAAFTMMSLCDTAAALVGRRWGRIRFGAKNKSLEGCLAAFVAGVVVAAIVVAAIVPGIAWPVGLAGAVGATLAESLSGPFDDNIRIPLVAGVFMVLTQNLIVP